jgi:hypothetical protein
VPTPGDYDDGEIGEIMIVKENWSILTRSAPVPIFPQ